jgi:DNA-binding IclR family transcriptional regulator
MGSILLPPRYSVNKLSHAVKNNGKRIRRFVKELLRDGYLLAYNEKKQYHLTQQNQEK